MAPPGAAVLVVWIDAVRYIQEGLRVADVSLSTRRETLGWCLEHTEDGIKLAMSRDEGFEYQFAFGIPAAYIESVTPVEVSHDMPMV